MKWIELNEKLPEESIKRDSLNVFSEDVLCYQEGNCYVGYLHNGEWNSYNDEVWPSPEYWCEIIKPI